MCEYLQADDWCNALLWVRFFKSVCATPSVCKDRVMRITNETVEFVFVLELHCGRYNVDLPRQVGLEVLKRSRS